MRGSKNKIICWLFKFIWQYWYKDHRIISVRSWRAALMVKKGGTVEMSTPDIRGTIKSKWGQLR